MVVLRDSVELLRLRSATAGLLLAFALPGRALQPEVGAVFVRILEIGPGLACLIVLPGDGHLNYDTGHWNTDRAVLEDARELIPDGSDVERMVLSHAGSDHLGAVDGLCDNYRIRRVLRTGLHRTTGTWRDAKGAIQFELDSEGCIDVKLQTFEYPTGATCLFGDVAVQMVRGFGNAPGESGLLNQAESWNGPSVVVRLIYDGRPILFCGDAVGRHIGDPDGLPIATEAHMIGRADVIPVDSDVLIVPRHGADNARSTAFINAVTPEWMIFSAGHRHGRPTCAAAERCLFAGIPASHTLRTDRGDDELDDDEWNHVSVDGQRGGPGNDDVDALIRASGELVVAYR